MRRFVYQFKPIIAPEPIVRFETPLGQQMQIDFTTIRRSKQKLKSVPVATLGYSSSLLRQVSFDNERASTWQQG